MQKESSRSGKMFLISVKAESEHKIVKVLRTKYSRKKIDFFIEDDIYDKNNYSKYKFIITEYNKDVIEYFLKLGKKVFIVAGNNDKISMQILNNKNVKVVKDVKDLTKLLEADVVKVEKKNQKSQIRKLAALGVIALAFGTTFSVVNNLKKHEKKKVDIPVEEKKEKIEEEVEEIPVKDYKKENYVFLGDSITDFYNLQTYYGDLPAVNSGISGDKTYDILDNLEERVYKYNPSIVFLMIGTNDLSHRTEDEIVENIIEICNRIHQNRSRTKIYVESIYPVNNNTDNDVVKKWMVGPRENEKIKEINARLEEESQNNPYEYIDMYNKLTDENGDLNLDYTIDGLHISEEGYEVITSEIKSIIESN